MMKHLHFIGIEGSGASAVAAVAKAHGYKVTGCDRNLTGEYSSLFEPKTIFVEHSIEHLKGVDTLVLSPAIEIADPNNTEIKAAKDLNLEILTWQQFLGKYLVKDKFVIAVCGTHGKSTTTAMIAKILEDGDFDPTVILGAKVSEWGRNYRVGQSKYLVVEADEYNNNFMAYQPNLTVVTNIDEDHLEFFKDLAHIEQSFEDFLVKTKEIVVANLIDPNVAEAVKWVMKSSGVEVLDFNKIEADFKLQVPGEFNKVNAKAAFQVGLLLGITPDRILESLNKFSGIGRRFEGIGELGGIRYFSDFAHHPREMFVTLEAARQKFPKKKITLIFQPHLYSRTKLLFDDFVDVIKRSPIDRVLITDIFGSRENDPGDISSQMLVKAVGMGTVEYVISVEEGLGRLEELEGKEGREGNRGAEVVILMGAGDIDRIGRDFLRSKK
jgi:UDP-N-acetylmuramate--alanine ligase